MILVDKIDFQGDDLYIHYHVRGDSDKHIRSRIIIVNWKANIELVELLKKMFQSVINNYMNDDEVKIDWERFFADFKAYEEKRKNE
jgi:hypothetical protein